jgi:hypothetical protein
MAREAEEERDYETVRGAQPQGLRGLKKIGRLDNGRPFSSFLEERLICVFIRAFFAQKTKLSCQGFTSKFRRHDGHDLEPQDQNLGLCPNPQGDAVPLTSFDFLFSPAG